VVSPAPDPDLTYDARVETVARLIFGRCIADQANPLSVLRACKTVDVEIADVKRWLVARQQQLQPAPSRMAHRIRNRDPFDPDDGAPQWRGGGSPPTTRRDENGGLVRRCCRCREEKPIDAFRVKVKRTGQRVSMCDPCRTDYQRERYLRITQRDTLAQVGLEFRWTEGDPELVCVPCGQPIRPGEQVVGDAVVRHARCAS
jgi:hypothetical protein